MENKEFLWLKDKTQKTKKEARALTEKAVRKLKTEVSDKNEYVPDLEEDSLGYLNSKFPSDNNDDRLRDNFAQFLVTYGSKVIDKDIKNNEYLDDLRDKAETQFHAKVKKFKYEKAYLNQMQTSIKGIKEKIEKLEEEKAELEQKKVQLTKNIDDNVADFHLREEFSDIKDKLDMVENQINGDKFLLATYQKALEEKALTEEELEMLRSGAASLSDFVSPKYLDKRKSFKDPKKEIDPAKDN